MEPRRGYWWEKCERKCEIWDNEPEETATASVSTDSASNVYKYKSDWIELFPWLEFENNLMFCKYFKGQMQAGNSAFVTGNPRLKKASQNTTTPSGTSRYHATKQTSLDGEPWIGRWWFPRWRSGGSSRSKWTSPTSLPRRKSHLSSLGHLHKKNGVDINPTYLTTMSGNIF